MTPHHEINPLGLIGQHLGQNPGNRSGNLQNNSVLVLDLGFGLKLYMWGVRYSMLSSIAYSVPRSVLEQKLYQKRDYYLASD